MTTVTIITASPPNSSSACALDAPEIESAEGKETKAFPEKELKLGAPILIKTSKSDKHDRYLANVFLPLRSVKTSSGGTRATQARVHFRQQREIPQQRTP